MTTRCASAPTSGTGRASTSCSTRPAADGSWGCYVGKAPAGIRTRLRDHLRNKDHWRRAVLIQRDTTFGFNSAQVAWLEGRLYDLLDAAEDARPHNGNRPSDETLPPFERASLENAVLPISRILRLIGYDPATADDTGTVSTTTKSSRTSRFYGITLKNIIDAGYLPRRNACRVHQLSVARQRHRQRRRHPDRQRDTSPHPLSSSRQPSRVAPPTAGTSGPSRTPPGRPHWRPCVPATPTPRTPPPRSVFTTTAVVYTSSSDDEG